MGTQTGAIGGEATSGEGHITGYGTKAYRSYVLNALLVVYILNFLDRGLLGIVSEPVMNELAITDGQFGLLTGIGFALFYSVVGIPLARYAEYANRTWIMTICIALWSAATALSGLAAPVEFGGVVISGFVMLLICRVLVGVGEAGCTPPANSIIADYYPPHRRSTALGYYAMGVTAGTLSANLIGGPVADAYGWRTAFIAIGVAGIIAALIMLFVVREPKRGAMDPNYAAAATQERSSFGSTFWEFMSRPALLWCALGCGFSSLVGYAALGFNAPFLIRVLKMTPDQIALWYALVVGVGIGIGTIASGAIVDRLSKRARVWYALVPLIAMAAATPFWYFYTQAQEWPIALALLILPLLLNIFYLAPALALVNNSVKASQRTMSSAILLMILNFIGLGAGPTLVGILSTSFATSKIAAGMDAAIAAQQGLREALMWMTPFFVLALLFIALEAMAIARESKAGKPVTDGGARVGILLFICGAGGLAARYFFGGMTGLTSTDPVQLMQLGLILVSLLVGLWLVIRSLGRKPAEA